MDCTACQLNRMPAIKPPSGLLQRTHTKLPCSTTCICDVRYHHKPSTRCKHATQLPSIKSSASGDYNMCRKAGLRLCHCTAHKSLHCYAKNEPVGKRVSVLVSACDNNHHQGLHAKSVASIPTIIAPIIDLIIATISIRRWI